MSKTRITNDWLIEKLNEEFGGFVTDVFYNGLANRLELRAFIPTYKKPDNAKIALELIKKCEDRGVIQNNISGFFVESFEVKAVDDSFRDGDFIFKLSSSGKINLQNKGPD